LWQLPAGRDINQNVLIPEAVQDILTRPKLSRKKAFFFSDCPIFKLQIQFRVTFTICFLKNIRGGIVDAQLLFMAKPGFISLIS
jgi:hypothetical protein